MIQISWREGQSGMLSHHLERWVSLQFLSAVLSSMHDYGRVHLKMSICICFKLRSWNNCKSWFAFKTCVHNVLISGILISSSLLTAIWCSNFGQNKECRLCTSCKVITLAGIYNTVYNALNYIWNICCFCIYQEQKSNLELFLQGMGDNTP